MMTAADVMRTELQTTSPEVPIHQALSVMRDRDIRHLLVLDRDQGLVGILSNRDYRRVLERADATGTIRGVNSITVADIMTLARDVITGHADTPLTNIAQLMVLRRVGSIAIIDEARRPVGIVTQKDVLAALVRPHLP